MPTLIDLPDPGIKPGSPALQADSLPTELSVKPIESICPYKNCNTNVHSSVIHKKQKWEQLKQSSINWMNKQNVVCAYNGVLFKHKKKSSTDMCSNREEPWKYYARWKKPDVKGHILYASILCELFRVGNSIEPESTVVSVFSRSKGNGSVERDYWWLLDFFLGRLKWPRIRLWWWLCSTVDILKNLIICFQG